MFCERCGKEITEAHRICPACGSVVRHNLHNNHAQTTYGSHPEPTPTSSNQLHQIYPPPADFPPPQGNPHPFNTPYSNGYTSSPPPYQRPQNYRGQTPGYTPGINPNTITITQTDNTALVAEIICSLFGIFGVGWLITRETTPGTMLLVGSFLIYWPLMILGTLLTLGLGLICLGPLAISAIIINIVLLNNAIKRKATHVVITPRPPSQPLTVPPQGY